ncbi:MAG: hypothetical protein ABIS29_02330 [Vicinamibacterales bacterium]
MTNSRPARSASYPWYDSYWLAEYVRCRTIIEEMKPAALPEFVEALKVFQTRPDFQVKMLDRACGEEELQEIRRQVARVQPTDLELHEARMFGRFVLHNHPYFTELQQRIVPLMSDVIGEDVEVSYNFLSLYGGLGVCPPHLDAPVAKWTLDLCLNQSGPWPIYISQVQSWPMTGARWPDTGWEDAIKQSPALQFTPYTLQPGEAAVFSGSSQWHYRDAIPETGARQFCDLLFFHFIPRGTRELVKPQNWARLFGIPELQPAELPQDP